jgi:hypothetical protein
MKRMLIKSLDILKARELYVCLFVYPLIIFCAIWIGNLLSPFIANHLLSFGIISIMAAALCVILILMEIFNRLMHHRIQGQHLALRQQKGVDIPNGINERNPK